MLFLGLVFINSITDHAIVIDTIAYPYPAVYGSNKVSDRRHQCIDIASGLTWVAFLM